VAFTATITHPTLYGLMAIRRQFSVSVAPYRLAIGLLVATLVAASCGRPANDTLVVYSGRSENLIAPLLQQFTEESGIMVEVRYEGSADLALLIETEADRSPADVFISQSPGAMGLLAGNGRLQVIDASVLEAVDERFRNADGLWVGMSGRVRVIVYNRNMIDPAAIPTSVFDLTDERFRGDVGIAPGNGSFQDFVTGMRQVYGDDVALAWLEGMAANDAQAYAKNSAIVQAVAAGEVPLGLVNHYYNFRAQAEDPGIASENFYLPDGDIGSLVIITAIGILDASNNADAASEFVAFMLGESAQRFFSQETLEYPLASGAAASSVLPPLSSVGLTTYDFDRLGDGLERTKELINASGLEGP